MARILLVEDEPLVRDALRGGLAAAGHDVRTAEDGESGLHAVRQHVPDLVVTDVIMPHMGGIVFLKNLRAERPDLPVVVISGGGPMGRIDFLSEARTFPKVWTLKKPFRLRVLAELVGDILGTSTPPGAKPAARRPGSAKDD